MHHTHRGSASRSPKGWLDRGVHSGPAENSGSLEKSQTEHQDFEPPGPGCGKVNNYTGNERSPRGRAPEHLRADGGPGLRPPCCSVRAGDFPGVRLSSDLAQNAARAAAASWLCSLPPASGRPSALLPSLLLVVYFGLLWADDSPRVGVLCLPAGEPCACVCPSAVALERGSHPGESGREVKWGHPPAQTPRGRLGRVRVSAEC